MRIPIPEIVMTALLAFGFAALGEAVLRRRSRDLFCWNESFLVGAGTCAAALFPLSLAWPSGALRVTLLAMAAATAFVVARRVFAGRASAPAPDQPPWPRPAPGMDPLARTLLVLLVLAATAFAALNFRYNYLWDGFQIWAARANLLHHQGGLTRWWFPEEVYDNRLLTYPPLVPMYEALLAVVRGAFDYDVLKPVFLVFYLSMLLSTYAAARAATNTRLAVAATLLLALLRPLSTSYSAGAYADMPQAALVAGAVAAGLRRRESADALPWLIGSLTTVKSEGTMLAGLACGAVLLAWHFERPRQWKKRLRSSARGIAIVGAFVASRLAYGHWIGITDSVYGSFDARHFAEALVRLRHVGWLCMKALLNPLDWGLFWPAFFAAGLILAVGGGPRERGVAAATAAGVAVCAVPFLFTNWPLELHIAQAYFRLLAQIAPAAAVAIVAGYARARGVAPASAA